MSLSRPHPILSSAGSSPAKVCKATVQSWFLSGRYRTESLLKHWSSNKGGCCLLSSDCQDVIEDVEHVLQLCPALDVTRKNLLEFNEVFIKKLELPDIGILIQQLCSTKNEYFCQFLIDCSSLPQVIILAQHYGPSILRPLYEVSRTWIFSLHRERLRRLGRWNSGG